MPFKTQKDINEEFYNHHARCFATDGEYTDAELVKIQAEVLKREIEWDINFLHSVRAADKEAVREMIKSLERNAENGFLGNTQTDEAYNSALSDLLTQLDKWEV